MSIAQQHGSGPVASPYQRLSAGQVAAVCGLSQHRQGHVTFENGPGGELLFADGALRADIRLAPGVPVLGDAVFTEGVTTGDGDRVFEAVQAYDAG